MQPRIVVPFIASLALCATAALAQDAPPPASGAKPMMARMHFDKDRMAKHHAQMCTDLYARAVGKLAYLETKLALTDKQKPLFERWKNVRLASVKDHAATCATMAMPDHRPTIMEHVQRETKMLQTRLAELKAETPSLEALVASLNDDQQKTLERAAMKARHMRMDMMERMHDWRGHRMHRDGMPPAPPSD